MKDSPSASKDPPESSGRPPLSLADYVAATAAWLKAAAAAAGPRPEPFPAANPAPAGEPASPPAGNFPPAPPAAAGFPPADPGWERAWPRLLRSAEYWQRVLSDPPPPAPAVDPGRETNFPTQPPESSAGTPPSATPGSETDPAPAAARPQGILYPRRYRFQNAGPQRHLTPAAAWEHWAVKTPNPGHDPGPLLVTDDNGRTWQPAAPAATQAAPRDPATLFLRDE